MRPRFAAGTRSALSLIAALILLLAAGARPSSARPQQNAPAAEKKPSLELTTDPSPPRKGPLTARVKLADAEGKPVTGAEVTVKFFMPAMPDMGMAAMTTLIKGEDKGDGTYEGKGELGSAGVWQVTITARQKGQTIATKKLTVRAMGVM